MDIHSFLIRRGNLKNYYQWLSIASTLPTREIQQILLRKMESLNHQHEIGKISDFIYLEAIQNVREAQAIFKNESSRQFYDLELNGNPLLASKQAVAQLQYEQLTMTEDHQKIVNRYRLLQKIIGILGLLMTFVLSTYQIGLAPAFAFGVIIMISILFVVVFIRIFRQLHFDQFSQFIKFISMVALFMAWYFALQICLNLVQFNIEDLSKMGNILIYALLISLVMILVVEWLVFQEEIRFEDQIRAWLDQQSEQKKSRGKSIED